MVTGDNVKTAKAIAVECGILSSFAEATEPNIIEGKRFRAMSDAERDEIADAISVKSNYYDYDNLSHSVLFELLHNICCKYFLIGYGTVISQ